MLRKLRPSFPVETSTLWIWLHNLNGFPHPKSFKREHIRGLSETLKIPQARIRSTLDASRHLFTPTERPEPEESIDTMRRFIDILENDKRKNISKAYVLHLAKSLHGSKTAALVIATILIAAPVRADELVTTAGKHYVKVRLTEVTPATISFTLATGAARIPLSELGPDVRQKFDYDPAKARAWCKRSRQQPHAPPTAPRKAMLPRSHASWTTAATSR